MMFSTLVVASVIYFAIPQDVAAAPSLSGSCMGDILGGVFPDVGFEDRLEYERRLAGLPQPIDHLNAFEVDTNQLAQTLDTRRQATLLTDCLRYGIGCKDAAPCSGHGQCVFSPAAKVPSYVCQCESGFSGFNCDQGPGETSLLALITNIRRRLDQVEDTASKLAEAEHPQTDAKTLLGMLPRSCKDILERTTPKPSSGMFTILSKDGIVQVFCDMDRHGGGWTRIGNIDPQREGTCPGTLNLQVPGPRLCTKPPYSSPNCALVSFKPISGAYSEVMGFVTGYRDKSLDAFGQGSGNLTSLTRPYVDGVSITSGNNRHVFTFAGGFSRPDRGSKNHCPCSALPGRTPPSFVGDNFYCSDLGLPFDALNLTPQRHLWSKESKCGAGSRCCDISPDRPWFHRTLTAGLMDPIFFRICVNQALSDEHLLIDRAAIFIR